jgi:methylase of polypeptide subunit release factors
MRIRQQTVRKMSYNALPMANKQRTFGQFETPADVADLLLAFCLRRPNDRLLDPSCGNGAFLARAALLQSWLASEWATSGTLWGVEVDPESAASAQEYLPKANIINRNFFELQPIAGLLFDAIIGNPPYTRAEWFGQLGERLQMPWQLSLFDKSPPNNSLGMAREEPEILSHRAGLHAHFLVHGTHFLREGGRFGFVVPNSWLDVAYGEHLKQYLLDHFKILALIESSVERWFNQAKVNTCLIVMERCSDAAARVANSVSLARLRRPLHELIPYAVDDPERLAHLKRLVTVLAPLQDKSSNDVAIRIVNQNTLGAADKWGITLRAPAVFRKHWTEASLHPLGNWATIKRGFTTGANSFFYLTSSTIDKWGIESEFRRPLLKSLRHIHQRIVTLADCELEVLMVPTGEDLSRKATGDYLNWGEEERIHLRRTCTSRKPWYSLPPLQQSHLLLAKGIWKRHFIAVLEEDVLFDQQLYGVQVEEGISSNVAAALLNSAWFALQLELNGRVNFGEGVLWLAAYELEGIWLPDPRYLNTMQLAELEEAFMTLKDLPVADISVETKTPAWQKLNEVVFRILGFTTGEGEAVTSALLDRIATRYIRARPSQ